MAEPIAAGGVGQVWRAADLLLDREVAVKLLRPEYADHPDTLERFRAEAKHAGSLTHPCVARVYDYGKAGPGVPPYLVMEYVDGPSLADMLAADPVHPVVALDVAAQAAAGLDAAHRIGLVHRDALGILIYECLTGLPPYDGGTAEVMAGHLYLPMPPLPAGVPPELGELITRLTANRGPVRQDRTAARDDARGGGDRACGRRGGLAAGQRGAARLAGRGPPDGVAARHHRARGIGVAGAAGHGAGTEPSGGRDVRAARRLRHGQCQPPGDAQSGRQPGQQPGKQRVPQPVQLGEPLSRAGPGDHVTGALADAPAAADLPRPVGSGVPGEPRARSG